MTTHIKYNLSIKRNSKKEPNGNSAVEEKLTWLEGLSSRFEQVEERISKLANVSIEIQGREKKENWKQCQRDVGHN